MDIIKKLNTLRLERNMSVYRLAELSGLNQSTLANIFSRGTIPSIHTLEAICDVFGISLAQFFSEGEELVLLTAEEKKFLQSYQRLPHSVKQSLQNLIIGFIEMQT